MVNKGYAAKPCISLSFVIDYMKNQGNVIIIESDDDEQEVRRYYGVSPTMEWDDVISFISVARNKDVLDRREGPGYEYTQVPAQRDPDFWDEAETFDEREERLSAKSIYHDDSN